MRGEKFVQLSSLLVSRQKSTEPLPADHPPSTRKTIAVLTVQHKPRGRGAQTSPRITEANPLPNAYFFTVWGLDELSQCVLSCMWAPRLIPRQPRNHSSSHPRCSHAPLPTPRGCQQLPTTRCHAVFLLLQKRTLHTAKCVSTEAPGLPSKTMFPPP